MGDSTRMTRLMKILYGIPTTAKTRIEKAVAFALGSLETNMTIGEGSATLTFDKTAAEVYAAVSSGRGLKILTEVTTEVEGEEVTISVTKFVTMEATKMEHDGEPSYEFVYLTGDDEGTSFYISDAISADDTVVLTRME